MAVAPVTKTFCASVPLLPKINRSTFYTGALGGLNEVV